MAWELQAHCKHCNKKSEEVLLAPGETVPCYCMNCCEIRTAKHMAFTFALQPCPECGESLRRVNIVSVKPESRCPWCERKTLYWDEIMQLLMKMKPVVLEIGDLVHGLIVYRGSSGQIVQVDIENGPHLKGKIVAGSKNYPVATPVECIVHSIGTKIIGLEVTKILNLADY